ncbi:MAG: TerD family protein [Actinobacteria bacterium]|nr:TerD family protein [Actinomycetota bacterium]
MAISLQKGGNANLSRERPGLSSILVGLGWDERSTAGESFDLDAMALLVSADGKVRNDLDLIFYNNLATSDRSVEHLGDNRTGDASGDDECIRVKLPALDIGISKVVFSVSIHDADTRRQNFGQVNRAYIRVVDEGSLSELVRYDLSEDFSTETTLVFGELYRHELDWKFRAVGQGYRGGLRELLAAFGLSI